MSHSPSQHARDREIARRKAEAETKREEERKAAQEYASRIVRLWNARACRGRPASFYPTIGTAIVAGSPILRFVCPACRQVAETDLREWDRHAGATIASLIPALSCQRCCPNPPHARLVALADAATMPIARRRAHRS